MRGYSERHHPTTCSAVLNTELDASSSCTYQLARTACGLGGECFEWQHIRSCKPNGSVGSRLSSAVVQESTMCDGR